MNGIRITERVELVDESGWVIAVFPTMHSARLAQDAQRRPTIVRYVDGPSCADCFDPPVANTVRGLRCVNHLNLDRIVDARTQHPSVS